MNIKEIITNSCVRVYNNLGYGLSEIAYEKALSEELRDYGLHTQTELHINQYYTTTKGRKVEVANLRIDILINDNVILELKTLESKIKKYNKNNEFKLEVFKETKEFLQCKRYMELTGYTECYLINFSKKGLEIVEIEK